MAGGQLPGRGGLLDVFRARSRLKGGGHVQPRRAADAALNDALAGTRSFAHKQQIARAVKAAGLPMVLCFVLHRQNLHQVGAMLALAERLEADYVELATAQYYGWALQNRQALLPTRGQLAEAEQAVAAFRAAHTRGMQVYYVVHGWGRLALNVAPDGTALPCHAARVLPGLHFPNVRERTIAEIWQDDPAFQRFRGTDWLPEPCRSCPEKGQDFGGCRCQAYLLTGDAEATDPACDRSPAHAAVLAAAEQADAAAPAPLVFRRPQNASR